MFARLFAPDHRGLGPLRPALRRLRPRPGPHRGRVDQGDHRQGRRQRRPRLPHPRDPDQGAALRAGQAPPLGAVDRLLQAPALREVPRSCTRWSTRPPSSPAPPAPRASSTPARPTSCSPRSTRSPRSSGRPRRPERSAGFSAQRAARSATRLMHHPADRPEPPARGLRSHEPQCRTLTTDGYMSMRLGHGPDHPAGRPVTAPTSSSALPADSAYVVRAAHHHRRPRRPARLHPSTTSRTCGSPSARPARWCSPQADADGDLHATFYLRPGRADASPCRRTPTRRAEPGQRQLRLAGAHHPGHASVGRRDAATALRGSRSP